MAAESAAAVIPVWGNLFVRQELKDVPPRALAESREYQEAIFHDLYAEMSGENKAALLYKNALFQLIRSEKPHAIIDCINTATLFAYQKPFQKAKESKSLIDSGATEAGAPATG